MEEQLATFPENREDSPGSRIPDFCLNGKIVIGTIDGDGIGPIIMDSCRAPRKLLADEIAAGKIELRKIEGADAGEQDRENGNGACWMCWQLSRNV